MKSITLRELHEATGKWVRRAAALGALQVTERGRPVARIIPEKARPERPYFGRRVLVPAYRRVLPRLQGGPDSTLGIAEERERA
jgi:antitoxin (DNA-binding transcriptional repressor) of toxin-antitoxin stability system